MQVPGDGYCLPASALLCVNTMYPNECNFKDVSQVQASILKSISDNSEHWRPSYDSTYVHTGSSQTFDECLAFHIQHPSGLWNSRMGDFMPYVLANLLRRNIIVRDLTNGFDYVTKYVPVPAIDPQQLRGPIFLQFRKDHYDALLPPRVESGIWKVSTKSARTNKPTHRAASTLSPNIFSVLSDDSMDMNSDSNSENVTLVSPETPERRTLTFEQPVQSDSSTIHDIDILRRSTPSVTPMLTLLLGIEVIILTVIIFSELI